MIPAGLLLLAAQPAAPGAPTLLEVPAPGAARARVDAYLRLPFALKEREAAAWRLIVGFAQAEARSFAPAFVRGGGSSPLLHEGDGFLHLEVTAPAGSLRQMVQVVAQSLASPSMPAAEVAKALRAPMAGRQDAWLDALSPAAKASSRTRDNHVSDLASQVFQPGNLFIVASGAVEPGALAAAVDQQSFGFRRAERRGPVRFDSDPVTETSRDASVDSIEIFGPVAKPGDPRLPALLAAAAALGTGKEASVYRVLREQMGLSYQQAAFLWPSAEGWRPRVVVLRRSGQGDSAEQIRAALLKDVEAWTPAVLQRAKAMTASAFRFGLPDGPLWGGLDGPLTGLDSGPLAGLTLMMGGSATDAARLEAMALAASLEDVKSAAKGWLEKGSVRVVKGRG